MQFGRDLIERQLAVKLELGFEIGRRQVGTGIGIEMLAQPLHISGGHAEADGVGMASETREKLAAGFEGIKQVESRDGAAGTECLFAFTRNNECRARVTLDDARCRNADDAAMPAVAIDHHAVRLAQRGLTGEPLLNALDDVPLLVLSVGIELIEASGNFARAFQIFHAEQIDHIARHVHAAGGIQSRRDAEGDFGRSKSAAVTKFRHFEQRLQPGIYGPAQSLKAEFCEHAIFAEQRHGIRDGGDGDDLHERHQHARLISCVQAALQKSLREFEGHARPAQIFAGIARIQPGWD